MPAIARTIVATLAALTLAALAALTLAAPASASPASDWRACVAQAYADGQPTDARMHACDDQRRAARKHARKVRRHTVRWDACVARAFRIGASDARLQACDARYPLARR